MYRIVTARQRGAHGESTARLARELRMDRKHLGELRHRLQENLYETLPADVMQGEEFEADELYQHEPRRYPPDFSHLWVEPV